MRAILSLAAKDLRILFRSPAGAFFTFGWPLMMAILFGAIFSGVGGSGTGSRPISLAVVDEDGSPGSREFLAQLEAAPELEVAAATRDEAWGLVRQGRRAAYVVITPGFGAARERLFWGDPPRIELGVDPRRQAEAGMLQGVLMRYAATELQKTTGDPAAMRERITAAQQALGTMGNPDPDTSRFLSDLSRAFESFPTAGAAGTGSGWEPLAVDTREVTVQRRGPGNSFAVAFPQGILWGILGCAATFSIGIVRERTRGTLVRLQMAPLSRTQILLSKAAACFAAILGIQVALLAIGGLAFGVRAGSVGLLGLAVLSASVGFVGIMMLLSVLGNTEEAAGGLNWAANLVMAMIGGGTLPLFLMPSWMVSVSHASPAKWAVLALEGALWRGFSPQEMLLPCGILLGVGLACFALGARKFRTS